VDWGRKAGPGTELVVNDLFRQSLVEKRPEHGLPPTTTIRMVPAGPLI